MKKILMLIICINICVALIACGIKEDVITKMPDATEETLEPDDEDNEEASKGEDNEKTGSDEEIETDEDDEDDENDELDKDDEDVTDTDDTDQTNNSDENTPPYKKVNDTRYASADLNIRSGPGTSYDIVGSLMKGQKIDRIGETDNGWAVFKHNDGDGYVLGRYLAESNPVDTRPPGPTATPTPKPTATNAKANTKPTTKSTTNQQAGGRVESRTW